MWTILQVIVEVSFKLPMSLKRNFKTSVYSALKLEPCKTTVSLKLGSLDHYKIPSWDLADA